MRIMNFMTRYYHKPEYKSRFLFFHIPLSFKSFIFVGVFFASFGLLSCDDKPTMIGGGILPDSDHISIFSTDTFRIISHTNYTYPISTQTVSAPYIGTYSDPYFGSTTCEFVSQIRLRDEFVKGSWAVDEVKLVLRIISNHGTNENLKYLRISEISNMLSDDDTYYSDTPVDFTGVGVSAYIPELRSDTINNIEIYLPNSFGEYLIRDQDKLFYTTEPGEEDFRNYFKGIHISIPSASASDPFLLEFDFSSSSSYSNYFIVHMHDSENPSITYPYLFLLDSRKPNVRFAKIGHDFSTASSDKSIENIINQPVIDSLSYVQGLSGVYTKISIPGLEAIKNDPARKRSAVNKANLIAPVYLDNITYTNSEVANILLARYVNAAGKKEVIPNYVADDYGNITYFSGVIDTVKCVYQFNLSNFVQDYFSDSLNIIKPEIEIFQSTSSIRNAILKTGTSNNPLKFELTLTDY